MSDLERITAAFHAMNPTGRNFLRKLAEGFVIDFPAPKPKPNLRLMQSPGASALRGRQPLVEQRDPASNPTARKAVINQTQQAVPDELIALFHSMDAEAQQFTLETARVRARRHPRTRPALSLVAGHAGTGALDAGAGAGAGNMG